MHIHWVYPWNLIKSSKKLSSFFFCSADNYLFVYLLKQCDLFTKAFMVTTYLRWVMIRNWWNLMLLMFQRQLLIPFTVWFNDFPFMCVFMTLLQAAEQLVLRDGNVWTVLSWQHKTEVSNSYFLAKKTDFYRMWHMLAFQYTVSDYTNCR